jgi:hypothetical protein
LYPQWGHWRDEEKFEKRINSATTNEWCSNLYTFFILLILINESVFYPSLYNKMLLENKGELKKEKNSLDKCKVHHNWTRQIMKEWI